MEHPYSNMWITAPPLPDLYQQISLFLKSS